MPAVKTRLLAIFRLLALIVGRYALHGLLSVVLSRRLAEARRGRLHRRTARHFVRTATRLGGVLIKVGQFLSTRVDVLPEAFTEELAKLQDRVPPVDYPVIRARLREELGQDPETVFIHFVPTPLAAASLGQVHEAMLPNGARVAVKVQYPAISELVETDLRALGWATKLLQWWVPTIRFDLLHQEFCHLLSQELDYLQEGRSADTFRANFSGDPRIVVPRIFWEFTTPRVLTLEFIDGIKITNVEELTAKGVSLPALARLVVDAYMVQLLEHRFFHGDPHPGNLFVQPHPDGPK
ncbi:MAG: ABC1 kinase family protein, partial [Nitrospirales bacterium]